MAENRFAKYQQDTNRFAKYQQGQQGQPEQPEQPQSIYDFVQNNDVRSGVGLLTDAMQSGGVKAIAETVQTGIDLGQAAYGTITGETPERLNVAQSDAVERYTNRLVSEGSNWEYVEATSKFFAGYVVGSTGIRGLFGRATTRRGRVAEDLAAGAYSDFTTTDPYEKRVSDVLYGMTEASNDPDKATFFSELWSAFKVDEDGTALENRLKAAAEASVLGLVADGVLSGIGKILKNAGAIRKDFGSDAAAEYIEEQVSNAQNLKDTTEAALDRTSVEAVADNIKQGLEAARVRDARSGEKTPFNAETLSNLSEATQDFVAQVADATDTRGVVTREARQKAVKKTLSKMDNLSDAGKAVSEMADNVETLPEAALMSNTLLSEAANRAYRLAREETPDAAAVDAGIKEMTEALNANRKIREAWGRTGQALQEGGVSPEETRKYFKDAGATDEQLEALEEFGVSDTVADVQKKVKKERQKLESSGVYTKEQVDREMKRFEQRELARAARKEAGRVNKIANFINTVQASSMLSGIGTQTTNLASGIFMTTWRPLVRITAGAITLDGRQIREGFGLYDGVMRALRDKETWQSIGDAFVQGRTTTTRETTTETISDWAGSGWWDWIKSNGYKTPLHLLAAMDEGFQRVNAKSAARVQAKERMRTTLGAAYPALSKADKEAQIASIVDDMFVRGEVVDENVKRYAQSITMTAPLEGGIGEGLETFFRKTPVLKAVFAPFFRTPMNLLREGIGSIPLVGYVSAPTRAALQSADPAVRAQVYASWVLTGGTMSLFAMKASNGEITGGYSKDARVRASQQASGIQPYSIKLGDTWYSFQRFEPLSIPLRMVADAVTTYENSIYDPDDDFEELFGTVTMSTLDSIVQGSMLKPMSDLVGIFAAEDGTGLSRFGEGLINRFSPAAYQQIMAASENGNIKTATNAIERLQRAYAPTTLPDKRNWITGEPIRKFYGADPTRSVDDKDVQKIALELQAIGGVSAPTNRLSNGAEMNAKQYDRYLELMSTTKVGGRTLKESLTRLVEHPQWQRRNYRTGGNTSWHQSMVTKIVNRYKKYAQGRLLREDSEILQAYRDKELERAYDKAGRQQ